MSWNTSVVTNAGVDLLNESLAGHTLTIESAVGGAGTQTEDEIKAATDVAEPKQALKLTGIEDFEDGKRIGIQITNEGISESYILHQIGVKAHLEYEEDLTLLFVLQDERGVEIPTEAENPDFIFEVYAVISISNEANIDVTVNTGVTASVSYVDEKVSSEISKHSEDTNSHQDIRDMATEAYDPESTYDAGAYCIYDGKLYKALDDISTPEAWTESHWEETSVGAELLELEAALSNKADNETHSLKSYTSLSQLGLSGAVTMEQVCAALPVYSVLHLLNNRDVMIPDTPTVYAHITISKNSPTDAKCYCATVGKLYDSFVNDTYQGEWKSNSESHIYPVWSGWTRIATATLPMEYNLPVRGGTDIGSGNSRYSKNQFGEIICQILIIPATEIPAYTILATLPEGFRPKKSVSVPAMISIDGTREIGQIGVNSSGEIGYYGNTVTADENSRIYASFSFVADI